MKSMENQPRKFTETIEKQKFREALRRQFMFENPDKVYSDFDSIYRKFYKQFQLIRRLI